MLAGNVWWMDVEAKLAILDGILERHPEVLVAISARAELYLMAGMLEEAADSLAIAVEDHPDNARLWAKLGTCHRMRDATDDARSAFTRALQIDSGLDNARISLTTLELETGNRDEAARMTETLFADTCEGPWKRFNGMRTRRNFRPPSASRSASRSCSPEV